MMTDEWMHDQINKLEAENKVLKNRAEAFEIWAAEADDRIIGLQSSIMALRNELKETFQRLGKKI